MKKDLVSTEVERSNGSLTVRLSGEIDLSNAHELQSLLENAVQGSPRAVIDLTGITYLDSQGVRLLKQLARKADREGTQLRVVAPPDNFARQVLEMTQMGSYVEIRDTVDD